MTADDAQLSRFLDEVFGRDVRARVQATIYGQPQLNPGEEHLPIVFAGILGAMGRFDAALEIRRRFAHLMRPPIATTKPFTPAYSPPVIAAISNICNLNCTICETQDSLAPKGNMALETFDKALAEAQRFGATSISLHHVNEPLLHPGIFDILDKIEAAGMTTTLSSNGNGIDKFITRAKRRNNVPVALNVRFSIDGGTAPTYNAIRRGGDFDAVVRNITALKAYCEEAGIKYRFMANFVMTSESVGELASFYRQFGHLIDWQRTTFSPVGGNTPTGLNDFIVKNRLTDFVRKSPCDVPFNQVNILRDGRVSLCCVDFNEEAIIGDIKTQRLRTIWEESPALRGWRKALNDSDVAAMSPICQRCYVSTANHLWEPISEVIIDMFTLMSLGYQVTDAMIKNRVRLELLAAGLDFADPQKPVRLYENYQELAAAAPGPR